MPGHLPQLAERLAETLGHADLRPDARAWGQSLLDRLKAPVQIIVMGPKGSGKSHVINMLSGAFVVPETVRAPVVEIVGGASEALSYECLDGTTGVLAGEELPDGVVRLTHAIPLTFLDDCSFAEVALDGPAAALEWALERADIVLWCSAGFNDAEQAAWSGVWDAVPEDLKDHSFLVLTHADRHIANGTLSDNLQVWSDVAGEEFLSLFPIATPLALSANSDADAATPPIWKSSGGKALYDAVHKRIEHGRLADQDSARLFLSRFAGLRQTRAAVGQSVQPPEPPETSCPDLDKTRAGENARETPARDANPGPSAGRTVSQPVLSTARNVLQKHADQMRASATTEAGRTPARILDQCVEAAEALAGVLATAPETQDAQTAQIHVDRGLADDAAECAEMMQLFRLERTEDAAVDAVTLLMQLKREIAEHMVG